MGARPARAPQIAGAPAGTSPAAGRSTRWPDRARVLLGALVAMLVVDRVGAALTGYLAPRHPLLLVALDATDKALLLAVNASVGPLVVLSVLRRLVGQLLYFYIGRHLGDRARAWLGRQGLAGPLGTVERLFRRAALPVVFLMPREVICLLAGDTGVGAGVFTAIVVVRDLAAVLALRLVSQALRTPIEHALSVLDRYTIPATAAGVVLSVASFLWHRRRRVVVEAEPVTQVGDL